MGFGVAAALCGLAKQKHGSWSSMDASEERGLTSCHSASLSSHVFTPAFES